MSDYFSRKSNDKLSVLPSNSLAMSDDDTTVQQRHIGQVAPLYQSDKQESFRKCTICQEAKPVSAFAKPKNKHDAALVCRVCAQSKLAEGQTITEDDD